MWALPNRLGLARLGLIVGRKAASRAVIRNSLKRLVRESFRLQQAELGALDLVVQARSRPGSGRSALRDDLLGLFMAVKAWRG